jgi:hypothetical protein
VNNSMTGSHHINGFAIALLLVSALFFLSSVSDGSQSTSAPAGARKGPGSELVGLVQPADQFGGFKKAAEPEYYFPETLFDYIDGGAELFLAYGFVELMVTQFIEEGNPAHRVTLEIYNMGSVDNAFGVSKAEQGGDPYTLPGGAEGRLGNGMLQFYKGAFYINIFLPPTSKAFPAVAEEIGKTIEGRIKGRFARPDFFSLLPLSDRRAGSEQYTNKDFLGQPFFNRIASAHYSQGEKAYTIFLSVKPDTEAAGSLTKYKEYLMQENAYLGSLPGGMQGFAGRDPYYGNCTITIIKRRIAGVLSNPDNAVSILQSMGGAIDEKK